MLELVFAGPGGSPRGAAPRLVNTWSDDAGLVFARAFVEQAHAWIEWPGLGTFSFTRHSPVVSLHSRAAVDRDQAHDIFVRIVQPIVLQAQGAEALHASAVAEAAGAIVFCGLSGSGKSTFAWALGCRPGFHQIADDGVVLSGFEEGARGDGVRLHPLPHRPRLRRSAAAHFNRPDDAAAGPGPPSGPLPLRAIVLLDQDTTAEGLARPAPLSASSAFTAILSHAHCFDAQDRSETGRMVTHYLALAAAVPAFRLCYRPAFEQLDELLDAVVATIAAVPSPCQ